MDNNKNTIVRKVIKSWQNLGANLNQVDEKYLNESLARSDELIAAIKKQRPWRQIQLKAQKARQQAKYDEKYAGADFIKKIKQ